MNTLPQKIALLGLAVCLAGLPTVFGQRELGKKKSPTSKMYLAEAKGQTQIMTEEKLYEGKQATAFDAPGTVIETAEGSHNAFVYSNGTGMYVDENTRVEVDRFVQEPFQPERNTIETEPSISQSSIFVARGMVGICTNQQVAGSSMVYSTPHAAVNIRGKKVAIQSNASDSVIYSIEGDVTIRAGGRDLGGQVLRAGEQAVISPGPPGLPPTVTISPIDPQVMPSLDEKVNVACNARKSVTFEIIAKKAEFGAAGDDDVIVGATNQPSDSGSDEGQAAGSGDAAGTGDTGDAEQEIVARPTVPQTLPTNIVVSPDRLPGQG